MASAKSFMNSAARAPSTTRWSHDSVSVIRGLIPGRPSTGTTRSEIAPAARMAAWGAAMMALKASTWYIAEVADGERAPGNIVRTQTVGPGKFGQFLPPGGNFTKFRLMGIVDYCSHHAVFYGHGHADVHAGMEAYRAS